MPAADPVLELTGCTLTAEEADGRVLAREVNWTVAAGEHWGLCGPAGAGKTHLLEVAAGLRAPATGRVRLLGRDPAALRGPVLAALRREVALVYGRGGRLFGHLTLAQNVALPLCYHRNCPLEAAAEETGRLLAALGLEALAARLPGQVNPAWQQRAALARALILRPAVLLLDHPFEWLNEAHARWWRAFLDGAEIGWPCPPTVVVTTEDAQAWRLPGWRWAHLRDTTWTVEAPAPSAAPPPAAREGLAAETPPG